MNTITTTVYYHADCLDGFGAAYAAWRALGEQACYRPLHHGEPWHPADVQGRRVYILDFSFPPDTLAAMAALAHELILIDHHVTAARPWLSRLAGDPSKGPAHYRDEAQRVQLSFDFTRAGCHLAWAHFHPGQPFPTVLQHVADVDLWRFELPHSQALCRSLRLEAFDFQRWDELIRAAPDSPTYQRLISDGEAIERFFMTEIRRLAEGHLVRPVTLQGECIDPLQTSRHGIPFVVRGDHCHRAITGLAANANSLFASELGNQLALQSGTFGMTWLLARDGEVKVSLRACNQVNVAALAEYFGGGGHPNAAGFRLPAHRFFGEILPIEKSDH